MTIEVSGTPPLLVSVTVCALDSCPITVFAKLNVAGESTSVGTAKPVPLSATLCVPSVSVKVSLPVTAPVAVGVKVSVKSQELAAGTALPHELLSGLLLPAADQQIGDRQELIVVRALALRDRQFPLPALR